MRCTIRAFGLTLLDITLTQDDDTAEAEVDEPWPFGLHSGGQSLPAAERADPYLEPGVGE